MTDGDHLLRAIIDEPAVDLHRLAYADWLTEQGQDDRAELIRVQVEVSRWPGQFHCYNCGWAWPVCACDRPMRVTLANRRADALLLKNPGWELPFVSSWRRGFVDRVLCTLDTWRDHGQAACALHPIERVDIADRTPRVTAGNEAAWWWREEAGDIALSSELPGWIWAFLTGRSSTWGAYHVSSGSDPVQLARDDLSVACIRWARTPT